MTDTNNVKDAVSEKEANATANTQAKPKKEDIRKTIAAIQADQVRQRDEKYLTIAKQRRKRAVQRAKSYEDRIINTPTEIEAKDSLLLDNSVMKSNIVWNMAIVLDDNYIKDAVFGSWQHLDECYNTFAYQLPAYIANKALVAKIRNKINGRFNDLRKIINVRYDAVCDLLKNYSLSVKDLIDNPDSPIQRATQPLKANFKYSNSTTAQFLRLCEKADTVITIEVFLEQYGYITQDKRIKDARFFQHSIRQYARSIFSIQTSFHTLVRKNDAKRREANQAKQEAERANNEVVNKDTANTQNNAPKTAPKAKDEPKSKPTVKNAVKQNKSKNQKEVKTN